MICYGERETVILFFFGGAKKIAMKVQTYNDTSAMAAGCLMGAGEIPMRIPNPFMIFL